MRPFRWTSFGLSLIEAMMLGLPVVAVGATEVPASIPSEAGVIATDVGALAAGVRRFLDDPDDARATGSAARGVALERFGVARFLADWDLVLDDVTTRSRRRPVGARPARGSRP